MTAVVGLAPQRLLEPGRYLLDDDGRLQPMRFRGFVRAVAIVTVKARADATAAAQDDDDADSDGMVSFSAALATVRARKAGRGSARRKPDGARLAAAIAARGAPQPPMARPAPTEVAESREECRFCGIPGWRGCDHFLPCVSGGAI